MTPSLIKDKSSSLRVLTALVASGCAVGAGLLVWNQTVDESTGEVSGLYFPTSIAAATMIAGVLDAPPFVVAGSFVVAQGVLVATTNPGDNDGLQMLWYPILMVVLLVLEGSSAFGRWVRSRVRGLTQASK